MTLAQVPVNSMIEPPDAAPTFDIPSTLNFTRFIDAPFRKKALGCNQRRTSVECFLGRRAAPARTRQFG
jgi:hypothetical protein